MITSREDIARVSAAARKLGGYQALIDLARHRREQQNLRPNSSSGEDTILTRWFR